MRYNKYVEILGLDPKITICKIAVLPIKLYPPFYIMPNTFFTNRVLDNIFF